MVVLEWEKLDSKTQEEYRKFINQIASLQEKYSREDGERFAAFIERAKTEKKNGADWDLSIKFDGINNGTSKIVDFSSILLYEYCLATERITHGKISFEECANRLFDKKIKIKLGNPTPGEDDEIIYGKSIDDKTALPVTSKLYRIVGASAQAVHYYKFGEVRDAIFFREKEKIADFGKKLDGTPKELVTENCKDFSKLDGRQSFLTDMRQTIFHEINHIFSKERIDELSKDKKIDERIVLPDGKICINYEKYRSVVEYHKSSEGIKEPTYVYGKGRDGKEKWHFQHDDGTLDENLGNISFGLSVIPLEQELCISSGLNSTVIGWGPRPIMINGPDEGMVETTARAQVLAITEDTKDLDLDRYGRLVAVMEEITAARDTSQGSQGLGQTYADFLTHSTVLKQELESKTVVRSGYPLAALHWIDQILTKREQFFVRMEREFSEEMCEKLRSLGFWENLDYDEHSRRVIRDTLEETLEDKELSDKITTQFFDAVDEDKKIPRSVLIKEFIDELGYNKREDKQQGSVISVDENPNL